LTINCIAPTNYWLTQLNAKHTVKVSFEVIELADQHKIITKT